MKVTSKIKNSDNSSPTPSLFCHTDGGIWLRSINGDGYVCVVPGTDSEDLVGSFQYTEDITLLPWYGTIEISQER